VSRGKRGSRGGKHVQSQEWQASVDSRKLQGYGDSFALRCVMDGAPRSEYYRQYNDPASELDPLRMGNGDAIRGQMIIDRLRRRGKLEPTFIENKSLTATQYLPESLLIRSHPDPFSKEDYRSEEFKRQGSRSKRIKGDPT
jgi:hypothetical protein